MIRTIAIFLESFPSKYSRKFSEQVVCTSRSIEKMLTYSIASGESKVGPACRSQGQPAVLTASHTPTARNGRLRSTGLTPLAPLRPRRRQNMTRGCNARNFPPAKAQEATVTGKVVRVLMTGWLGWHHKLKNSAPGIFAAPRAAKMGAALQHPALLPSERVRKSESEIPGAELCKFKATF